MIGPSAEGTNHTGSALGPIIFAKAARTSVDSAADYVARSSRVSVLSMVVVSAVGVVLLPPVIGLVYGQAFATAAFAFYALLPGILCDGVGRVLTSFLHSRDIILWRASLVSVVANIALNLVLIPLWGICLLYTSDAADEEASVD